MTRRDAGAGELESLIAAARADGGRTARVALLLVDRDRGEVIDIAVDEGEPEAGDYEVAHLVMRHG